MTVQVYSPPSAALVSTEHCLSVEPDTTMVTSGHTIQGETSEFASTVIVFLFFLNGRGKQLIIKT